jgi:hypothetical protein
MQSLLGAQPNQGLIDGIATLQALATSSEPIGAVRSHDKSALTRPR